MKSQDLKSAESIGNWLAVYIAFDPLYDWLSSSSFNLSLGLLRLSDVISLFFLAIFIYLVQARREGWGRLDTYAWSLVAITFYRIAVDLMQDGDVRVGEDVPRMLLNLVLYVSATGAIVVRRRMLVACGIALSVYYIGCVLQIPIGGLSQRFTSIYLIPNFLAFNAINIFVLVRALGVRGAWAATLAFGSIGLIVLSKTRTVLMTIVFFYKTVKSAAARYVVIALLVLSSILGAGESVRISGEVDDFWNFDGRVPIWISIIDRFDDFNLLLGSGSDALRRFEVFVMYDEHGDQMGYLKAQNHYLQTLVELGLFGLIIWIVGVFGYLRRIYHSRRWNGNSLLGLAFVSSLLVIQIFENDIFINPTVSIVLGLLVSKSFYLVRR